MTYNVALQLSINNKHKEEDSGTNGGGVIVLHRRIEKRRTTTKGQNKLFNSPARCHSQYCRLFIVTFDNVGRQAIYIVGCSERRVAVVKCFSFYSPFLCMM